MRQKTYERTHGEKHMGRTYGEKHVNRDISYEDCGSREKRENQPKPTMHPRGWFRDLGFAFEIYVYHREDSFGGH